MGAVDGETVQKTVPGRAIAPITVAAWTDRAIALDQGDAVKFCRLDSRAATLAPALRPCHAALVFLLPLVLGAITQLAIAQQPDGGPLAKPGPLGAQQVVQNLVQMNLRRLHALDTYQGTRTYRLEYRGFAGPRSAEMVVNVKYHSPGTKEFAVQSATGSKLIIDRVFKKLLEAEMEAQEAEVERRSALSEDNYRFTLMRSERAPSGVTYVLEVDPRRKDKFLYRGRIWVDATDFAVVRVEAEPAKNPSFWTKKADIVQVYTKVSDFWLPASNHSATATRLGGHADLTIDYDNYVITGARHVSGLSTSRSAPDGETAAAQD